MRPAFSITALTVAGGLVMVSSATSAFTGPLAGPDHAKTHPLVMVPVAAMGGGSCGTCHEVAVSAPPVMSMPHSQWAEALPAAVDLASCSGCHSAGGDATVPSMTVSLRITHGVSTLTMGEHATAEAVEGWLSRASDTRSH
ncbi:MAG: hypothetical protein AAF577_09800 [Pseudomonadota bacterium]